MIQAVILAAGKSTRTHPLTLTRPKPLLPILDKTLIEHNLDQLVGVVKEVIIIVGFKKEMIISHLGKKYKSISIKYLEQKQQLGTGHAIIQAKKYLNDKFIVMNGDDLYNKKDIKDLLKHKYCLLVQEVPNPQVYGIIDKSGKKIKKLIEKPKNPPTNLANIGLYLFDMEIFNHNLKKSKRGEYEITDYINYLIKNFSVHFEKVKEYWLPIGYPWQLLDANEFLISKIKKSKIIGKVEKGVVIKGPVIVGKGTVIKSGSYIEGPVYIGENCNIGPNCYIRKGTTLGDECKVGNACEVKNSIFFRHAVCGHLSYIGDSILGENVNLGAGTITANLRHDNNNVKTGLGKGLYDTGRRKCGAVIADNAHTGIHTSIYPGRKIWPGKSTSPSESVKKDIV